MAKFIAVTQPTNGDAEVVYDLEPTKRTEAVLAAQAIAEKRNMVLLVAEIIGAVVP